MIYRKEKHALQFFNKAQLFSADRSKIKQKLSKCNNAKCNMQNETNLSVWPAYSGLRILITSKQRRANICKRLKKNC